MAQRLKNGNRFHECASQADGISDDGSSVYTGVTRTGCNGEHEFRDFGRRTVLPPSSDFGIAEPKPCAREQSR
jgi:hypothetical protein